jgi:hypothetical protein
MLQRRALWWVCLVVAMIAVPDVAVAQKVGVGPRISQVRSDAPGAADRTRLFGGTLRIMSSKHVAIEGTIDYRSETDVTGTLRMRETPIQGSLLFFPIRRVFSPYVLGGMGLYTRRFETLGVTGSVQDTVTERTTGMHLGVGAEMFVVPQAALFLDYRWRFVRFGDPGPDEEPIDIPVLDSVKLSHRGSMWSGGVAFYF